LNLSIASPLGRLALLLAAAAAVVVVVVVVAVVAFDVIDGDEETVSRRKIDWMSPFPCDMLNLAENCNVASQMILKTSCRLWPLRSFFCLKLYLKLRKLTAQHRLLAYSVGFLFTRHCFPPLDICISLLKLRQTTDVHHTLSTSLSVLPAQSVSCFSVLLVEDVSCASNLTLTYEALNFAS
jgi:hypothetical protein